MTEIVGKLRIEIRPDCYIDILLHVDEQMIKELWFSSAVAKREIFILILIWNFDSIGWVTYDFGFGIVEIEQYVVQF